jgi:hypothetical protein
VTDPEALQVVRRHFDSLFPKTCASCGRRFASLREYIVSTTRVGPAKSYDAELGDWKTTEPIGSLALANCPCGSTLALSTEGLALPLRQALLSWVKIETQRRGVSSSELLEQMRDEIRKQVLSDQAT